MNNPAGKHLDSFRRVHTMDKIDLFVPGRLCLIGEHSDWAGINRMMNADIVPGYAIVTGIEQGIYATVTKADKFIIESNLECYGGERFECEMDTERLRGGATEGGFFSYVAGVASYVYEHYRVKGIHVVVTEMDLPIKSGLSSSAAICVLVARAFNKLYHLHLNTMGEMNIAYMGEQRTPSRCGRLDQACAYGVNPVLMTFDGNDVSVKTITIRKDMHWVVTDLNAGKDTVKILTDLGKCFPFAKNELEKNVQEALGCDNKKFVFEAIEYIENGDSEGFGRLMCDYQENFDKKVAPACESELTAPVLHSVLSDERIREFVYGGKGVGSQGDGTVQFLARDEDCQVKLINYLKEKWNMDAVPFTLKPQQKIKKAIIPVAGFGTRLFPVTKNLKKSFFPIMDQDGILKPALLILLEQLDEAGIEKICLVIGEDEQATYDEFFDPLPKEHYEKLPDDKKHYEDLISKISKKVTYVIQRERRGFGHAVYQCREFTNDEPVLLLLGDMIYHSYKNENCMSQMIQTYEKYGQPVVSLHRIPKQDVVHYGILHGQWEDADETVLKLDEIREKPSVEYAEDYLNVKTKSSKENFYAVFGQYVLTSAVFETLKENIDNNLLENGEIQLTSALETVRSRTGMMGYVVAGKSYDIGLPEKYLETMMIYGK
jgi:UTP-glucose-1-phosphate uridylyltransferase/mevalonate kinase